MTLDEIFESCEKEIVSYLSLLGAVKVGMVPDLCSGLSEWIRQHLRSGDFVHHLDRWAVASGPAGHGKIGVRIGLRSREETLSKSIIVEHS